MTEAVHQMNTGQTTANLAFFAMLQFSVKEFKPIFYVGLWLKSYAKLKSTAEQTSHTEVGPPFRLRSDFVGAEEHGNERNQSQRGQFQI